MKRSAVATAFGLVALCTSAFGYYAWQWTLVGPNDCLFDENEVSDYWLSKNNGTPAVAMSYGDWTSVGVECRHWIENPPPGKSNWSYDSVLAFEYKVNARWTPQQGGREWPYVVWARNDTPGDPCVVMNDNYKLWMGSQYWDKEGFSCMAAWDDIDEQSPTSVTFHHEDDYVNVDHCFAGTFVGPSYGEAAAAVYSNNTDDARCGLLARKHTDEGWSNPTQVAPYTLDEDDVRARPTLAVTSINGASYVVHCVYQVGQGDAVPTADPDVYYKTSTNYGVNWIPANPSLGTHLGNGKNPCAAAVGPFIFMCWHRTNRIAYKFSRDAGANWYGPDTFRMGTSGSSNLNHTSVGLLTYGSKPDTAVLLVSQYSSATMGFVFYDFGVLVHSPTTRIMWQRAVRVSEFITEDPVDALRPSVVTQSSIGRWVYNAPVPEHKRGVYLRSGRVGWVEPPGGTFPPDAVAVSTGRRIAKGPDGTIQFASVIPPQVVSGPADTDLPPMLVAPGSQPGLALDGDGEQWIAYICDDTVWVRTGENSYEVAFAGSSSAVPGQPSIVCYSTQGGSGSAANVVFAVYDTAGGASKIMYARVDTSAVVLDTIESVNTLRDSLPCISIYKSDTMLVTWQHGDFILSSLLSNYGPSTQGQPPAWSSANLVTASGYHPMSVMENGSVLNCVWTAKSGSNYSVNRSTNDLGGGMFGNWVAMTAPSAGSSVEKANSVYAGVGASVWQQKDANGKWIIRGMVRGDTMTFVANDTDAYHPHAVAESSAVSPSIDQVRVHLLYTAGVAFEVDSGVYDTGETRYKCESLNVSHAGSDATRCNNGAKLLRKDGSDSLFAAYSDADGAVVYAWSAAGDSWRREIVTTERSYPAIAADSTGKRWVVARTADGSLPAAQYLYYQSGGSWTSQSLYSGMDLLGPAGLAGASSTTTGIAYAAFKVTGMSSQYIVLTKFNGTTVAACTVATGSNLGDPAVAVEAYKTDSDHVHVTWEDAGVVKYRMDTDGRSSGIAANWTSVVSLSDAQATSHHPAISADRDQIVAAWAQGATADVYYRKRSTDSTYNNWEAAANLSNTANDGSDWPTIALGDTVVVAWEETRSGGADHDILASIDFGDTLNVADNATVSGYPHVLFYNKASGDTAIPYLHTIWSETPSESYYEVGYIKLNLKQSSGEGQQSASSTPIPTKPTLTACRPNPFRDRTQISYALPTASNVSLRVYDVSGRTVRTLASGHQKAGSYSVTWDSRDNRGQQVPRGVYFYRLDTPGFRSVKKAVVTR